MLPPVARWNGQRWNGLPASAPVGSLLWANSPRDIWSCCEPSEAATANEPSYQFPNHWDGERWTRFSLPYAIKEPAALWSRSLSDAWLLDANGVAVQFDGSAWVARSNPDPPTSTRIWGAADGQIWVLGARHRIDRWNGAWQQLALPGDLDPNIVLDDAWGTDPNNVWVVGSNGTILHWNGASWSVEDSGTSVQLFAIWGLASGQLWIVGADGTLLHREF